MSEDPVDLILEFTQNLEGLRLKRDPLVINDRDRWFVTLILSMISDPNHRIGRLITKDLIRVWIARGGVVPVHGFISRELAERGPFEFAVQYLYDYGMSVAEIARAFNTTRVTIHRYLKFLRDDEAPNHDETD